MKQLCFVCTQHDDDLMLHEYRDFTNVTITIHARCASRSWDLYSPTKRLNNSHYHYERKDCDNCHHRFIIRGPLPSASYCRECVRTPITGMPEENPMPDTNPDTNEPIEHGVVFRISHEDYTLARSIINKMYADLKDYVDASGVKLEEWRVESGGSVKTDVKRTRGWKQENRVCVYCAREVFHYPGATHVKDENERWFHVATDNRYCNDGSNPPHQAKPMKVA